MPRPLFSGFAMLWANGDDVVIGVIRSNLIRSHLCYFFSFLFLIIIKINLCSSNKQTKDLVGIV
jgi:hypothetical protein